MIITPSATEVKSRVIAYVDGFNLYFGICDSHMKRYLWLDLPKLVQNLLTPEQVLMMTKYFTSRVTRPGGKQRRQSAYLDALATLPTAQFQMFYGKFMETPRTCQYCRKPDTVPSEKMTDVNIAVEMLADAYQDSFDTALLISADSDLCAPVSKIVTLFPRKRVVLAFPPCRQSTALVKVASTKTPIVIGRATLRDSQFSDPLVTLSGYSLKKPSTWA